MFKVVTICIDRQAGKALDYKSGVRWFDATIRRWFGKVKNAYEETNIDVYEVK